jgi:3',5'-nucleoside bisphosphate phosphatase
MKLFRADLHIHTVLSPCGDLDMSPGRIVEEASGKGLDIIGITDHNSTLQCSITARLASEKGIFVLQGAEVTTKEEVHCLAFFENSTILGKFQDFLDSSLPPIMNDPEKFGVQVVVDENEIIVYEEKKLLFGALNRSLEEVESYVHSLKGLFIPAHIDKKKNSIYSQLGFLPEGLKADALEVSYAASPAKFAAIHPEINGFPIIRSSDAHLPGDIGRERTGFYMRNASFQEIREAIAGSNGRRIETL